MWQLSTQQNTRILVYGFYFTEKYSHVQPGLASIVIQKKKQQQRKLNAV